LTAAGRAIKRRRCEFLLQMSDVTMSAFSRGREARARSETD
jgi:hypothetical protein